MPRGPAVSFHGCPVWPTKVEKRKRHHGRRLRTVSETEEKKAKGVPLQLVEYGAAASLLFLVHLIPFSLIRLLSSLLGRLFFLFGRRRRSIALENLNHAFPHKKAEEVERIARRVSSLLY